MSLKILLADDSMTAQNMGKKILSEAGYEVIAVSNGAAALKKIAEQKPEVVILDIYMPGYSGLEVCERLKSTIETARVPVLLTVGKLEPFRPEDAVRVRAEGVIIKPFEATELLAAVEKAGTLVVKPVAKAPAPEPQAYEEEPYPAMDLNTVQATAVEIPDEVAESPAFGLDDVKTSSVEAFVASSVADYVEPELDTFAPVASDDSTHETIPELMSHSEPAAEVPQPEEQESVPEPFVSTPEITSPGPETEHALESFETSSSPIDGDPLLDRPVSVGPVSTLPEPEVFVDNPDPGEVRVERDPDLWRNESVVVGEMLPDVELTSHSSKELVDAAADPGLIERANLMSELENFAPEYRELSDDLICETEAASQAEPALDAQPPESAALPAEDDFDALVSAALAKFEPEPLEAVPANGGWRAEQTDLDHEERTLSLEHEMKLALAIASGGSNAPASEPGVQTSAAAANGSSALVIEEPAPEPAAALEFSAETIAEPPTTPILAESVVTVPEPLVEPVISDASAPEPEAHNVPEPPVSAPEPELAHAAVAGAMLGQVIGQPKDSGEQDRLVEAIGRVLERLKPQIVSELAKELGDKK